MLIEFTISNFKSFNSAQTLSMVAGADRELKDTNTFRSNAKNTPLLLNAAAIFGPNAAGKTNLIVAMTYMRNFIRASTSEITKENLLNVFPFKMDKNMKNEPSSFEAIFVSKGVRYQYGFSISKYRVESEYLYAFPSGASQKWFSRETRSGTDEYDWKFGSKFKGAKEVIRKATRNRSLFLSTAIQLNNEQLIPVFDWFDTVFHPMPTGVSFPDEFRHFTVQSCESSSGFLKRINGLIAEADLGISKVRIQKTRFEEGDTLPTNIPENQRKGLVGKDVLRPIFQHKILGTDEFIDFALGEESDGTKSFFVFLGPLLDVLDNGYVLAIDEIDTSLHPLLVRFIMSLFCNKEINRNNAQLVFTTHDVTIMSSNILRRDQYWFIDKDENHSSSLYPLTDFRPRKGEAIQNGYLKGRYGALPFIDFEGLSLQAKL